MDQRKAIDRNFLRSLTSLGIAILLGGIFSGDRVDAEVPPSSTSKRMMLFLGRDAVVKESEETQILLGANQSLSIDRGTIPTAVRSANENQYVATAAQTLTTYLEKVTGQRVVDQGVQHIQLHAGGIPTETFPELSNADAHGFVIATRTDGLHIAGASGIGTLFGVWFFLQNYADVRILMQGDLGEYVRKQENLTIPKELYIFNPGPDFHLRIHSGLQNLNPNAWLQDQGNHPGVEEPLRSQLKEWDTHTIVRHGGCDLALAGFFVGAVGN